MDFLRPFIQLMIMTIFAALCGCAYSPSYTQTASLLSTKQYTENRLPSKTTGISGVSDARGIEHFEWDKTPTSTWWKSYDSQTLNELIEEALQHNQTLLSACANLKESEETLNAKIGQVYLPNLSLNANGTRQRGRSDATTDSKIFNVVGTNIQVAYTFDLFGANRNAVKSLLAKRNYAEYQLRAAQLTVISNVVSTVIQYAALSDQIDSTVEMIDIQAKQLLILKKQLALGGISNEPVLAQETVLEQTKASLPVLENQQSAYYHALNVLLGRAPGTQLPHLALRQLTLPNHLPVSLPSRLIKQRPDILAASALVDSAGADVGVATAALFPQINLTGAYGWQGSSFHSLIAPDKLLWSAAAQLTQPIFQGGALLANRRASIAAFDVAFSNYQQTILQSFQSVADSLRAIEFDAVGYQSTRASEKAAKKLWILTKKQYELGATNYLALLNAEVSYQKTHLALIQSGAKRYLDSVSLFASLGGDWWTVQHDT